MDLALSADPVLGLLDKTDVSEEEIYALCKGYEDVKADDVIYAFHVWTSILAYLKEVESGWFSLLQNYAIDTTTDVDQFHLDLAVRVGARSQELLDDLYTWNVKRLKRKVNRMMPSIVSSDAASLLTVLVLRILSKYSQLEFKLQLALSRSTLIKINYELTGLLSKVGNKAHRHGLFSMFGNSRTVAAAYDNPLLMKYRSFVKQLLDEMESTPFESVQQEMFQVVHDLRQMFVQFSQAASGEASDHTSPGPSGSSSNSAGDLPLAAHDDWKDYDIHGSRSHKRTVSASTSAFSTPLSQSVSSAKTSIADELPSMMQAFKQAEKQQHVQPSSSSAFSLIKKRSMTNSASPRSKSNFSDSHLAKHLDDSAPNSSLAFFSHKKAEPSLFKHQQSQSSSHLSSSALSPIPPSTQNLEVKMIDNRMMVKTATGFMDMQSWLNTQNSQSIVIDQKPLPAAKTQPKFPQPAAPNTKDMTSKTSIPSSMKPNQTKPVGGGGGGWFGLFGKVEKDFGTNYTSSMGF